MSSAVLEKLYLIACPIKVRPKLMEQGFHHSLCSLSPCEISGSIQIPQKSFYFTMCISAMFLKGMVAQCAILWAYIYIYRENTSIWTPKCFTDVNESWLGRNIICIYEQGSWGMERVSYLYECRKALTSTHTTCSSVWLHSLKPGVF